MCGPTSVRGPACMVLGMQTSSWLPMASLGQTITTHQGKQLGVTKISSPCDCVPMFGLLHPNLTHFVHTIEANWGHALQFCRSPRAFPTYTRHAGAVHLTCSHRSEQSRDGEVMNKWIEEPWRTCCSMERQMSHHGVEALALKILLMRINLRSHDKSRTSRGRILNS